jgi:hypothetical protein
MDSEITTLCYGSDNYDSAGTNPATPQGGHFHRGYIDGSGIWRGIAVNNNIFLTDANVINANVWNSDLTQVPASQLKIGSNGGVKTYDAAVLQHSCFVMGVRRLVFGVSYNEYFVSPANANGIEAGQLVTADVQLDNTFDVATAQAVAGVDVGLVRIQDAEAGAAVTHKFESGTITATSKSGRMWWPYWIKSRLIGSKLSVKAWRYGDHEPDWSDTRFVNNYDFAGANIPTPSAQYPSSPGACGLIGNHIRNNRWFEYGYFSCRRL